MKRTKSDNVKEIASILAKSAERIYGCKSIRAKRYHEFAELASYYRRIGDFSLARYKLACARAMRLSLTQESNQSGN